VICLTIFNVEVILDEPKVTSSKLFYRGTKSFDEDGLFSEKIFGPTKDFRCKCGKLNSEILDYNKRCDKCDVLCVNTTVRFENHGIIDLPFMCIKPTRLKNKLKDVVTNVLEYKKTLFNPVRSDYNITQSKYLGIHKNTHEIKIFADRNNKDFIYIPLRITGIYSFILCLRYIAFIFNFTNVKKLFDDQVIMSYLKVIPPGIRPVTFNRDKNNKIQLSEVNKHYISILELNKSNSLIIDNLKIDEEDWFNRITLYFQGDYENSDEEIVENFIIECDGWCARYQYRINDVYDVLFDTISGKEGFIRNNMLGKTIEFSARSVICCDPSLEPYQIGVSKKILYKLWMLYFLYYLVNIKNLSAIWCFDNITTKDYEDNIVLFNEFLRWMYDDK
jgi:DNA-directed RNA polymerase subunit beta'